MPPSDREDRGALGKMFPARIMIEIHDWIHDWNRATQEIHDWYFFESKEELSPA